MKIYKYLRLALFLASGILVLVFNQSIMNCVGLIVGLVVAYYSIDDLIECIYNKEYFGEHSLLLALVNLVIAIALFIVDGDIVKVCLIWAVWSILREGAELTESIKNLIDHKYGLINAIESIVVIVFSFTMILEPSHHHAHLHVIILGIELLLEVFFPILENCVVKLRQKKATK